MSHPHPQSTQNAIAALEQSHTDIHQALQFLKEGGLPTGKQKAIAAAHKIINALSVL